MSASPTISTRRYRPSRRGAILDAALEEYSANGYADTTLAAVAARAGISTAAVYYHFEGKLAVLAELLQEIGSSMVASLDREKAPQSLQDLFVDSHSAFAGWVDSHPRESMLWFERSAGIAPNIEQVRRAWTTSVARRTRDVVSGLHPGIDGRVASVIGLAVPVLLEEYARLRLQDPTAARGVRRRRVHESVIVVGRRLDGLARATAQTEDPEK